MLQLKQSVARIHRKFKYKKTSFKIISKSCFILTSCRRRWYTTYIFIKHRDNKRPLQNLRVRKAWVQFPPPSHSSASFRPSDRSRNRSTQRSIVFDADIQNGAHVTSITSIRNELSSCFWMSEQSVLLSGHRYRTPRSRNVPEWVTRHTYKSWDTLLSSGSPFGFLLHCVGARVGVL